MPPQQPQHRRPVRRPDVADSQNATRLRYTFHTIEFLTLDNEALSAYGDRSARFNKKRLTPEKKCE
jgi:hypothetical protein